MPAPWAWELSARAVNGAACGEPGCRVSSQIAPRSVGVPASGDAVRASQPLCREARVGRQPAGSRSVLVVKSGKKHCFAGRVSGLYTAVSKIQWNRG